MSEMVSFAALLAALVFSNPVLADDLGGDTPDDAR